MAKLSHEQIAAEVASKGYTLIDDSKYSNMQSPIIIKCNKGHIIETSLAAFRHPSFTCPQCDKNVDFINPGYVPPKQGYRIVAFDQATEHFGVSIFEDGKLIYYHLYVFTGTAANRLYKIKKFVEDVAISS